MNFLKLYFDFLYSPLKTALEIKEKPVSYCLSAYLVYGIFYLLFSLTMAFLRMTPPFPVLPIEPSSYYFIQAIYIIPFLYLMLCLYALVLFAILALMKNKINFYDIVKILSFSYNVPHVLFFLIPFTILFLLFGIKISYIVPLLNGGGFLFSLWLTSSGIKAISSSVSRVKGIITAFIAFLPIGGISYLLIR